VLLDFEDESEELDDVLDDELLVVELELDELELEADLLELSEERESVR
jgi:hypothetical protein